jgi:hypothetical protein
MMFCSQSGFRILTNRGIESPVRASGVRAAPSVDVPHPLHGILAEHGRAVPPPAARIDLDQANFKQISFAPASAFPASSFKSCPAILTG